MIVAALFLLLSAVFLWALIDNDRRWRFKLPVVFALPFLAFAVWHGVDSYRGWPKHGGVPKRSIVVGKLIIEPDRGDPGRIYLWLVPIKRSSDALSYHPRRGEPRAFVVPYTRQLHEQLARPGTGTQILERATRHGGSVHGRPGPPLPRRFFRAYRLPPQLPPKG